MNKNAWIPHNLKYIDIWQSFCFGELFYMYVEGVDLLLSL